MSIFVVKMKSPLDENVEEVFAVTSTRDRAKRALVHLCRVALCSVHNRVLATGLEMYAHRSANAGRKQTACNQRRRSSRVLKQHIITNERGNRNG